MSAHLLDAFAQLLSRQKGSPGHHFFDRARNPQLPRKRVAIAADPPTNRYPQSTTESPPQPGVLAGRLANLVVQQKVFQAPSQPMQFLALEPRKDIPAQR